MYDLFVLIFWISMGGFVWHCVRRIKVDPL